MRASEQLWWRSTERGFRYTTMLCNGGARTFNHLSSLRVYGDVELQKEECVNHVMKCLGTAQVGSIGKEGWRHARWGGFGKLKQTTIVQFTKYYGPAVRAHPNYIGGMQDAVLTAFESSADEKPQHNKCPLRADTWCFIQKARTTGQEPGPHTRRWHCLRRLCVLPRGDGIACADYVCYQEEMALPAPITCVTKRRWYRLQRLRVAPVKACEIITVCVMLHTHARLYALPDVESDDEDNHSEANNDAAAVPLPAQGEEDLRYAKEYLLHL